MGKIDTYPKCDSDEIFKMFEDPEDEERNPFLVTDDEDDDDIVYDDDDYESSSPLRFNGCPNDGLDDDDDDLEEFKETYSDYLDANPADVIFDTYLADEEDDDDEDDKKSKTLFSVTPLDEDYDDIDIKSLGKFAKNQQPGNKNKNNKNNKDRNKKRDDDDDFRFGEDHFDDED